MTDPIRESIMDNIVTVLETVTTGNGYNQTIYDARRVTNPTATNVTLFPAADVDWIREAKDPGAAAGFSWCHLTVSVGVYTNAPDDPAQSLSFLVSDAEKALMIDNTRGGYAIDTAIQSVEQVFIDPDSMLPYTAAAEIIVDVEYRHSVKDPTSSASNVS